MMRKKSIDGLVLDQAGDKPPAFLGHIITAGEKNRGGSGICRILWQLFPSFTRIQGQALISPFLLNFTPFSIRQALSLFGNFGLVAISLILFIHAVSFAYSSFSLFYQTCTFVIFCFLNSLFPLNKAFFVYDGFSLLFSLFSNSLLIQNYRTGTPPKRRFLWLMYGEIYRKNKPSLLIKLYPKNSPLYKFPPLSNN